MAKKKKAVQSANAKEQTSGGSDELVEEEVVETDAEVVEDPGRFVKTEDEVAKRMIMRRKLEQYLEERRLKKELGDDYD